MSEVKIKSGSPLAGEIVANYFKFNDFKEIEIREEDGYLVVSFPSREARNAFLKLLESLKVSE